MLLPAIFLLLLFASHDQLNVELPLLLVSHTLMPPLAHSHVLFHFHRIERRKFFFKCAGHLRNRLHTRLRLHHLK